LKKEAQLFHFKSNDSNKLSLVSKVANKAVAEQSNNLFNPFFQVYVKVQNKPQLQYNSHKNPLIISVHYTKQKSHLAYPHPF